VDMDISMDIHVAVVVELTHHITKACANVRHTRLRTARTPDVSKLTKMVEAGRADLRNVLLLLENEIV